MRPDKIKNIKIPVPIDYNLISILDVKHELIILSSKINLSDIASSVALIPFLFSNYESLSQLNTG